MGVSFLFLFPVTIVGTLTSNILDGLNVCSSDVSPSGQVPSQEQAPTHTGGRAAGSPAGRSGFIPVLFHHHPNCQPAPVCQFFHRRAKGTSEKVRVPSLNPDEQNPEDEGFPRTELAKYCFSLGPALRKVNKALLWKPKISSKNPRPAESGHEKHGNPNSEQSAKAEIYRLWPVPLRILEEKKKC